MSHQDEDDKPTVVLDLNALKKQKLKAEEDLANIASELEFNVGEEAPASRPSRPTPPNRPTPVVAKKPQPAPSEELDSEDFAEQFLEQRQKETKKNTFPVILFDFQSDFFKKSLSELPQGYDYKIVTELAQLNNLLKSKSFQIVVFNYDVNPKAVNQLSAQIKLKFPTTKTLIMARAISPEKAKVHAQTPSGASGYYQYPLNAEKVEKEFLRIFSLVKKVG